MLTIITLTGARHEGFALLARYFQFAPRTMAEIMLWLMENLAARSTCRTSPRLYNDRIIATCSSDSFARPFRSFELIPFLRPLRRMSAMLSECDPINRWLGLQHLGLSHLWHTHMPTGIFPFVRNHANLCANHDLFRNVAVPYPSLCIDPPHSTHPLWAVVVREKNESAQVMDGFLLIVGS